MMICLFIGAPQVHYTGQQYGNYPVYQQPPANYQQFHPNFQQGGPQQYSNPQRNMEPHPA